jgi:hypothetical protein
VFADIARRWGSFDIDLFASRLNYKVPCYVSWRPDPDVILIDAFYMDWGPYLFYVFPPFSMIATCLQKITQDKATGVLIVPIWTTQPWFTGILNLLMDKPLILSQSNSLLTQPHNGDLHPLRHQLRLTACKVSGKASNIEEFQMTLLPSSSSHGLLVPRNNTNRTNPSGTDIVLNGRLIPTIHL